MDNPIKKEVLIGDCRLLLGDCLSIMPTLGKVDAVVTDPPYGANLGDVRNGGKGRRDEGGYECFDDTPEYVLNVCVKAIVYSLTIATRAALTPGKPCIFSYPNPDDIGVWYSPAPVSRGKWGFQNVVAPILYYGQRPSRVGNYPNSYYGMSDGQSAGIDHPCPKPLNFMKWLVDTASNKGETVLDPFMGSGSTGIACIKLGRKFIGIELEPKYFDIACRRIEEAYKQPDLFIEPAKKPVQEAFV